MDSYNKIKCNINNKLLFKLSQIGYALHSDMMFTNRVPEIEQNIQLVNNLKYGDKIFISLLSNEITIDIHVLVNILQNNNIKVYFYLMYEPIIPEYIINILLPVSLGLFLNNNIYESPLIHCMPIGIRDCEKIFPNHKGFSHDYLFNEGTKISEKKFLCLLCYSYTHQERYNCYNELKDKPFVNNLNDGIYEKQPSIHCGKVPVWIAYEYTHKSYYTLSPRGAGEDCHRFYEAIYLDSIPIVKKTNTAFDKLYSVFPCLIVDDWNEITEELLLSKKSELGNKLKEFKFKYPNAFMNLDSIHELLLQT
uniref:Exostosin GT47 domain-containing protein n=1 Tax=viral metagenome TaxID=1070528 RepID=A0A6C0B1A0_9ZZZZ